MQCCNIICQWENEPGGVPIRIKHLLHSSAVRYGEIFHESENISPYLTLTRVISLIYFCTLETQSNGASESSAQQYYVNSM